MVVEMGKMEKTDCSVRWWEVFGRKTGNWVLVSGVEGKEKGKERENYLEGRRIDGGFYGYAGTEMIVFGK